MKIKAIAMSTPESDHVKVSVISSGNVWKANFSCSMKIHKLISSSLSHFHGPSVHCSLKSLKHKMVLVRNREVLSADKSLTEEGLKDNGGYYLTLLQFFIIMYYLLQFYD